MLVRKVVQDQGGRGSSGFESGEQTSIRTITETQDTLYCYCWVKKGNFRCWGVAQVIVESGLKVRKTWVWIISSPCTRCASLLSYLLLQYLVFPEKAFLALAWWGQRKVRGTTSFMPLPFFTGEEMEAHRDKVTYARLPIHLVPNSHL